jgi:TonB family protein
VAIDGRRRGVTPLRVPNLAFGDHAIEVTLDGYNADRQRISLTADRAARNVAVTLTRSAAATTGAVSIVTEPAGARVLVDGAASGNAPLTVANLSPGKHAVQTERDGYDTAMREVEIKAGETLPLTIRMTASASRSSAPVAPVGPLPFEVVEVKPRLVRGADSPSYPRAAIDARLSGVVQIAWIVDEDGAVNDVQVLESTAKVFEVEVVSWAKSLRYSPGRQAGKPVKVRLVRRFSFQRSR